MSSCKFCFSKTWHKAPVRLRPLCEDANREPGTGNREPGPRGPWRPSDSEASPGGLGATGATGAATGAPTPAGRTVPGSPQGISGRALSGPRVGGLCADGRLGPRIILEAS